MFFFIAFSYKNSMYEDSSPQKDQIADAVVVDIMDFTIEAMRIEQNAQKSRGPQIGQQKIQDVLRKHISYHDNPQEHKKHTFKDEKTITLKKPPLIPPDFSNFQSFKERFTKIMFRAYNYHELKLGQFEQLYQFFQLDKNSVKLVNYLDPVVIQTLRYAVFNKQEVPNYLVKVISQMSKTNLVKQWEGGHFSVHKAKNFPIFCQNFQPPLDLYTQMVKLKMIQPSLQQLKEVFTRNQFFFKAMYKKQQFYSTLSKKKRLVYNQFPYLLEIFGMIQNFDPESYNYGGLKLYLDAILDLLELSNEDHLFQRYLPEVNCRFLKLKNNLNTSDIQFLFITLKNVEDITKNEYKILFHTKPSKSPYEKEFKYQAWTPFWQVQELCSKIMTDRFFHINSTELQSLSESLYYQSCYSIDLVKMGLIMFILRQQSHSNQQLSKPIIKNLSWILRNIPDNKIRKQCCYILLSQSLQLFGQDAEKRRQITKQLNFPEVEIDLILDEGRQIALQVLINLDDKSLILEEGKWNSYLKTVKKIINETKNKVMRNKAILLYQKMKKINKFNSEDLKFLEANFLKTNQLIQLIQIQTQNSKPLSVQTTNNVIKILQKNSKTSIRRSCLITLRHVIKNYQNGQQIPENFQERIVHAISILYFQKLTEQCKMQILKLAIDLLVLPDIYSVIDILTKFLLEAYLRSSSKSTLNINSSYGLYLIVLNLEQKYNQHPKKIRNFLDVLANKMFKGYKNVFQPTSKGSINILCIILILAKIKASLPPELSEELILIAFKQRQFLQICLMAVFFLVGPNLKIILSQRSLLSLCQMLKQNKNDLLHAVYILQSCYLKQYKLPESVTNKIKQLTQTKKCMNFSCQYLCNFYKNHLKPQFGPQSIQKYWLIFKNLQEIQLKPVTYAHLKTEAEQDLEKRIRQLKQSGDYNFFRGDFLDLKCLGFCQRVKIYILIPEQVDFIDCMESEYTIMINVKNLKNQKKLSFVIKQNQTEMASGYVDSVLQIFAKFRNCDLEQIKQRLISFYEKIKQNKSKKMVNMLISHRILQNCGLYRDISSTLLDLILALEIDNMMVRKISNSSIKC